MSDVSWLERDKEAVVRAACTSGCVSTLIALKQNKDDLESPSMQRRIAADEEAWTKGIAVLSARFGSC